jgi:excisionase family DNA binding protein
MERFVSSDQPTTLESGRYPMPEDLTLRALGAGLASLPELLREILAELQSIRLAIASERPIKAHLAKDELLTTAQVAEILGLSEGTLSTWRCTRQEEVPYLKIGRCVRYKRSDVEAWVRSWQQGTTP